MSQGRATPVGWVQLPGGYTIRWRRGDPVAHVLPGARSDEHGMAGVLATIAVSPSGWTDLAEIRQVGQTVVTGAATAARRLIRTTERKVSMMARYRGDPLASVTAQFPLASSPFDATPDGGTPSGPVTRPWGLRWLRPAPARVPPAYRYCPVLQVAVSADGSGRLWMDSDGKEWSSIAELDGDEGKSEDYGWDTTGDVS